MDSAELGDYVEEQIERLWQRIMGPGQEQYGQDEHQLFETMPLETLFEYAREELDDIIVYAVMTQIRLNRMEEVLRERIGEDWDAGRVTK